MRRGLGKWASAATLFFALNALIFSLSLYQMTAEGTSKHALRRSIAALTEIDALIERDYEALQERATASEPADEITLTGFPIAIGLTAGDVSGLSPEALRALVLDRSDDVLYQEGTAALRAPDGSAPGRFSAAGLVDRWLGFLRERNHTATGVVTIVLAVVCGLLAASLAAASRGFGRLVAVGATVAVSALPPLAGSALIWLYLDLASDEGTEYTQRVLLEVGQALALIPLRNSIAFIALGATFVVVGAIGAMITGRRQAPRYFAGRV